MVMERGVRGPNTKNLDYRILKAGEGLESIERRGDIGIIAIRVGDLLISGSDMFTDYITPKMKGRPEVGRYEGKRVGVYMGENR